MRPIRILSLVSALCLALTGCGARPSAVLKTIHPTGTYMWRVIESDEVTEGSDWHKQGSRTWIAYSTNQFDSAHHYSVTLRYDSVSGSGSQSFDSETFHDSFTMTNKTITLSGYANGEKLQITPALLSAWSSGKLPQHPFSGRTIFNFPKKAISVGDSWTAPPRAGSKSQPVQYWLTDLKNEGSRTRYTVYSMSVDQMGHGIPFHFTNEATWYIDSAPGPGEHLVKSIVSTNFAGNEPGRKITTNYYETKISDDVTPGVAHDRRPRT